MSKNWLLGLHKHHERAGANEGCPRTDLGEKPGSVFPQRQLLQETLHSTQPRRLSLFGNHFLMEINLKIQYALKTTYMGNWEQNEGVKVSPQGAQLYSVVYHICLVWFLLSHLQLSTHLISKDILNPPFFSLTFSFYLSKCLKQNLTPPIQTERTCHVGCTSGLLTSASGAQWTTARKRCNADFLVSLIWQLLQLQ